jgi:hypothetical protein
MSTHIKSELSLLSELLLSLLLTACLGLYCLKSYETFPWLSFIGVPLGLALIVACWEQKKHPWTMLVVGLLLNGMVWSIVYNWSSILKIFQ